MAIRLREESSIPLVTPKWIFTIPKLLRPYFLRDRELLGGLCGAACQSVREMMVAATGEHSRHPHLVAWRPHAIRGRLAPPSAPACPLADGVG